MTARSNHRINLDLDRWPDIILPSTSPRNCNKSPMVFDLKLHPKIGMGVAWNTEDPTSSRDDIIDIARALVRRERRTATRSAPAYA